MLSKAMLSALNDQIQKEFASGYLYLAMAAHLEAESFPGAAVWMKMQAQEEYEHAMKLFDYVADRGGRLEIGGIEKPKSDFGDLLAVFKAVLEHEKKVTGSIHQLYEVALAEKDYATQVALQWFITEQVEEEKSAEDVVVKLEACDGKPHLMVMMDGKLAKRAQG